MRQVVLFTVLGALCISRPTFPQGPATPEAAAHTILEAMWKQDYYGAASLTHPAELRRTRMMFDSLLGAGQAGYIATRIFRLPDSTALLALDDVAFTAGLWRFISVLRRLDEDLKVVRGVDLIGILPQGRDTAHAVYRWRLPPDSLPLRSYNVKTLVRCGTGWCASMMGDYRPLLAMLIAPMVRVQAPIRVQDVVPVHREPRHRLVLDSIRFRILDIRIAPGDTTLFHVHDAPMMYVDLSPSPVAVQDLGGGWTPRPPVADTGGVRIDSTYVTKPVTHRVTNTGPTDFRLLGIVAAATSPVPDVAHAELPGSVQIRSTWFWQARYVVAPRSSVEWCTSRAPVLIVQPSSGQLDVEMEGKGTLRLERPGNWSLVPAHTCYRLSNRGTAGTNVVAIQIR